DPLRTRLEALGVPRRLPTRGRTGAGGRTGLSAVAAEGGLSQPRAAGSAADPPAREGDVPDDEGSGRFPVDRPRARPPGPTLSLATDDRAAAPVLICSRRHRSTRARRANEENRIPRWHVGRVCDIDTDQRPIALSQPLPPVAGLLERFAGFE